MKTLITSALIATVAMGAASVASAGTYRIDVNPSDGVVFAPFGTGTLDLEAGATSEGAVKEQAINGTPIDALKGHDNNWFIVEAEEGDVILLTAMQGNSLDTIGQARIVIPSAKKNADTVTTVTERVVKDEITLSDGMLVETARMEDREVRTPNADTPAQRFTTVRIHGFDAGADEGTDELKSVDSLGYVAVTRMSK